MKPAPPVTKIRGHEEICTLLWSPSTRRWARGCGGRGDFDVAADEGGLDPADAAIEEPRSTIEYSISLSLMRQSAAIEVNGPT